MDRELDALGTVQVAVEIEHRRLRLYERMAPRCADARSRDLCRELMAWSHEQVSRLTGTETHLRSAAVSEGTTYGGDTVVSNARLMTALALFVAESSTPDLPAAVTREWMLTDAVNRSRQAMVFYEGLKGFTHDLPAAGVMDEILQHENEHLHQMLIALEPYKQARCRGGSCLACVC
jgi:hypothetical protein